MRNYPEWMLAYWATISIGAVCVGMNAWWTGPEMEYGMKDAEPKVLICDQERLDTFLPHRDAGGLHARQQTAPRAVAPQAVQVARRQDTKGRSQGTVERQLIERRPVERRRPGRWLFRHVAWQPPPGREPAFAAFDGNPIRPKRGHLPIR